MKQLHWTRKRIFVVALSICVFSVSFMPSVTQAFNIGNLLRIGGVALVVDRIAAPLNSFINTLLIRQNAGTDFATKVVPIISVGSASHIGAAQVTGPDDLVEQTKAVLQVEGDFNGLRVKAVIPIDSVNPTRFSRIQGVGVSAIIDINI